MIRIKTINSEVEIREDIVRTFKQYRVVDQKAFYLGAGSDIYYHPDRVSSGNKYDYFKIAQLIAKVLTQNKEAKVAIVGLACGNCEKDRIVLEHVQEAGYDVPFFGVDSSMAMLHKANSVLSDAPFEAHLICADVGAFHFKRELDRILGEYDLSLYLFFGNTVGNLNQNYIARMLSNILRPGDYILLDVVGFETITPQIEDKLLRRYTGYLSNPEEASFFLYPLKSLGVPEGCGKLTLKVTKDDTHQARVFTFGFEITTSANFNLEGEEINLSPNDYIDLHLILSYDLNALTVFLEKKKFALKDQLVGEFMNQLLLQRQ